MYVTVDHIEAIHVYTEERQKFRNTNFYEFIKVFIKQICQVELIKFVSTLILYIFYEVYSIKLFYFILKLSLNLSKILIF